MSYSRHRQLPIMPQAPRRRQQVTVALPASLTVDIPHLREKTARIGFIARALAIFRIDQVLVYNDQNTDVARREGRLIEKVLKFQETPPYLRRDLFKVDPELAFAGVLPPLRTPHHPDRSDPEPGLVREAVVVSGGPASQVNAGFKELVTVNGRLEPHARVTVRVRTVRPRLEADIVDPAGLAIYWGPKVNRDNRALGPIIKTGDQDLTLSTSRGGTDVREAMEQLRAKWRISRHPLILFGSPSEGIPEILAKSNSNVSRTDFNLNTIPGQGVETIRTEEALLGTLAVLNLLEEP